MKKIIFWMVLVLILHGHFTTVWADHHHHHRSHGESSTAPATAKPVPIINQTYEDQCGACHFAYQPFLLPSGSWEKILSDLDNHYDQEIDLAPESKKTIAEHLRNGAAEKSSKKLSRKIMKSLGSATPLRITDTPYIKKKHHEISSKALERETIGSLANCSACHTGAEEGTYDEDLVKVPH